MNRDKRNQLVKDIQDLGKTISELLNVITQSKDIDKAKALSLSISGAAASIQVALSEESSL